MRLILLAAAALLPCAPAAAQTTVKVSALPVASTLTGAEQVPLVQSGTTKAGTTEQQRVYTMSAAASLTTIRNTACAGIVAGTNVTKSADTSAATCTINATSSGGGGSSVAMHPGYRSQTWYRPGPYGVGNGAAGSGALACVPMYIVEGVTWDAVSVTPLSSITSGSHLKAAIYANASGTVGAKIWESPELNVAAGTASFGVTATLSTPQTHTAGVYWQCTLTDTAQAYASASVGDGYANWSNGAASGANAPSNASQVGLANSAYGYANGFPANGSTASLVPTTIAVPMVAFRKQ
ncbi:hypothetical protein [Sphingomonas adhaesiva]|uniref:hypothetical protein n=1 Tax=Sphingomonas adhaesiva TaxID=28212 RepID=UPI002FF4F00D